MVGGRISVCKRLYYKQVVCGGWIEILGSGYRQIYKCKETYIIMSIY